MENLELKGKIREGRGKGVSRRLRKAGLIPGILYGGEKNLPVIINQKDMMNILKQGGENIIFLFSIEGENGVNNRKVMIKEIQRHPLKSAIFHVDLMEISMDRKIKVNIPVRIFGESIGIANKGGILSHLTREIEIECLPGLIPDEIKIDISPLDIGDSIHIRDIKIAKDIKILNNPNETVITVTAPEVKKEEIKTEEEVGVTEKEEKEEKKEGERKKEV